MSDINVKEIFPGALLDSIHEQYPHVGKNLEAAWGTKWFEIYVEQISYMDRPDREGFAIDTLMSLQALDELHQIFFKLYGKDANIRNLLK